MHEVMGIYHQQQEQQKRQQLWFICWRWFIIMEILQGCIKIVSV